MLYCFRWLCMDFFPKMAAALENHCVEVWQNKWRLKPSEKFKRASARSQGVKVMYRTEYMRHLLSVYFSEHQ